MEKSKLPVINDLKKLRITKVKDSYKVYFEYDEAKYMIRHEGARGHNNKLVLYRRDREEPYKVEPLAVRDSGRGIEIFIKDISSGRPRHIGYAHINREYFAKVLAEHEFCLGKYRELYKEYRKEYDEEWKKVRELLSKIDRINDNWQKVPRVGSRQDTQEIKARVAERVIGKEDGEYCEEYNDYYGNVHPEYGGVLVDLFNLTVGARFTVTNGDYRAVIGVNNKGNKVIITSETVVELNKDRHSAYIEMEA